MKKLILAFTLISSLAFAGVPAVPVSSTVPANTDLKKVESAIIKGAKDRKWIAKPMGNNTVEISLSVRSHRLIVTATYDKSQYTIKYKDSTNLDYDAQAHTIHSKYQKWLNNLVQAIDSHLVQ